jgi:hypothetical protein
LNRRWKVRIGAAAAAVLPVAVGVATNQSLNGGVWNWRWLVASVGFAGLTVAADRFLGHQADENPQSEARRTRTPGEKPLRITVETLVGDAWTVTLSSEEAMYGFPEQPGIGRDIHDLLIERGAADHEVTQMRLHLENISTDTIDVRNIRAVKTAEGTPNSAAKIHHSSAGSCSILSLRYRLDDVSPLAWETSYDFFDEWKNIGAGPYFATNRISLQPKETFEIIISGTAENIYCEWHLEIDILVAGETAYLEADNNGVPFRTSGTPDGGFNSDWTWVWWEQEAERRGFRRDSEIYRDL